MDRSIDRVAVRPMNIPSQTNAMNPANGIDIAQTSYSRAAASVDRSSQSISSRAVPSVA